MRFDGGFHLIDGDAGLSGRRVQSLAFANKTFSFALHFVSASLVRVTHAPNGTPVRSDRPLHDAPYAPPDAKAKTKDQSPPVAFPVAVDESDEQAITYSIHTPAIHLACRLSLPDRRITLAWSTPGPGSRIVSQDLPSGGYPHSPSGQGSGHYIQTSPDQVFLAGELASPLHLNGRRVRVEAADALGYNATSTDPLYKVLL